MAEKVIGLDVGTNAVRAVAVTLGERPRLDLLAQVALAPGAVHEGEVIDPALVASSVKTLWKEGGFGRQPVRVGIASARVILRVVDMPDMPEADTRSALRLQLGDYVPLAPNATVFDFQRLAPEEGSEQGRLLLAAAPRDAVEPLIAAVRQAGLKVAGVDVIPAALARVLARDVDHDPEQVRAIVSLGAGTIVVAVARGSEPLFARTVTNVSGGHITDRIAAALAVSPAEAERLKWHSPNGQPDDLTRRVQDATEPTVNEIVEEIRDSLDYFASQPGGRAVESIVLTGGDALIVGLRPRLEERVGVPVSLAEPFTGFDRAPKKVRWEEIERLSPFMAAAVGIALGGAEEHGERIDLTPETTSVGVRNRFPVVVGGGIAAALVVGGGYLYVHQGEAISAAKAQRTLIEQQLTEAQAKAAAQVSAASPESADALPAVYAFARGADTEWATVAEQLDGLGEPMGVAITSIAGSATATALAPAPAPAAAAPAPAPASGGSSGSTSPSTTTPATTPTTTPAPGAVVSGDLGNALVTGTAPDLDAIAAWIDAVSANPRFGAAWVDTTTKAEQADGSVQLQFTAQVPITKANLVPRNLPEANPA